MHPDILWYRKPLGGTAYRGPQVITLLMKIHVGRRLSRTAIRGPSRSDVQVRVRKSFANRHLATDEHLIHLETLNLWKLPVSCGVI